MNRLFPRWARRLGALIAAATALPAFAGVVPSDHYQSVVLNFDRSAPPADHYLWTRMTHGWSEQHIPGAGYTNLHFVCLSSTDPATGQCSTTTAGRLGTTNIPLRFTERRSGLSYVLVLKGQLHRRFPLNLCNGSWDGKIFVLTTNAPAYCGQEDEEVSLRSEGTGSTVWLPQSELAKLPTGGIWTAKMILKLKRYYSQPISAANTYTVDFKLDVTDHNNMQIYLPAYGISTPQVDLNLRTRPLSTAPGGVVSGQAVVDACLYDGYNANSQRYEIRVTGMNPVPGMDGRFFAHHVSGGTGEHNRIEYKVRTRTANLGETQHQSGQPVSFTGINNAEIRAVKLPNVPFPVVCTPWPITLDTPDFNQIDKNSGQYRGELKLEFTPSTSSP
ncbi:CfaE/CblD family pilus tip adhesin [Pseudomonas sp. MPB03]|uniref:CfaE/CblD family pilus tip adhesin n=1 Tax=Pseudomonas sp. MPB03 TaxID=3388489 RepID=UPI003984BAFF